VLIVLVVIELDKQRYIFLNRQLYLISFFSIDILVYNFLCIALHTPAYVLSGILNCILLHMYFQVHCIAYPCICTFRYIALHTSACILSGVLHAPAYLLVSHFTCIKRLLGSSVAQGYKPQVVLSK